MSSSDGTFPGIITDLYVNGQRVNKHIAPPPPKRRLHDRKRATLDPSAFIGPKLKVERAKRHLQEFTASVKAFNAGKPYDLTHEIDPKTGENVYRARVYKDLPADWSMVIGDIVHNLRSALDQLVCELVRANRRQIKRGTGFPISRTAEHFEAASVGKISGVSPKAERLIRRLKPYKGGNTPLWILHELDALDKHQGIIPVAAAHVMTAVRYTMPFISFSADGKSLQFGNAPAGSQHMRTAFGTPEGFKPIYPVTDNVELYRSPQTGMPEEVEVAGDIAFGKSQIAEGESVFETLNQLTIFIERTIRMFERYAS